MRTATARYDMLEVETRHFKGPRAFDPSGMPLHEDNKTVIKERIYLDKANPNILHDEITVIDNALTRPWTVTRDTGACARRGRIGPRTSAPRGRP